MNAASRLVTVRPGADYDGTDLQPFPAVDQRAVGDSWAAVTTSSPA